MVSVATVAEIRQVPAVDALSVAVAVVESESVQPVAVPPAVIAKVTAPVPLFPLVLILRACEYG